MPQASTDRLSEYRRKRDFRKTPEPAGDTQPDAEGHLYVMHKHAASHDHFDLRLEQNGVLRSWALPKGPSLEPGERRLAVEVEDHPLDYGGFEGVIPKGEYGGGTVMLWDAGHWKINGKADENHVDFILEGRKLKGAWTLVRTRGGKKKRGGRNNSWLLIKRSDKPAHRLAPDDFSVATGRSMAEITSDHDAVWTRAGEVHTQPAFDIAGLRGVKKAKDDVRPRPQLATLTDAVPAGDDWLHEIKFDGYRLVAVIDHRRVRLYTRNGHDWTTRFPEVAAALAELDVDHAVLDGEVVALSADGTTSFRSLQEALSAEQTAHLVYQLFDVLRVGEWDLTATPLIDRKRALRQVLAHRQDDTRLRYSDHIVGQGGQMYTHACELGLEGIISKRCDAPYRSGRTRQWLKVKCTRTREFVVGGYTRGAREGFGALLLGAYENGDFVYAGRVGTGFGEKQIRALKRTLDEHARQTSPFAGKVEDAKDAFWVAPTLVVEVEFTERTRDGRLRHPVFRGVREDRDAREIGLGGDAMSPAATHEVTNPRASPRRRQRRDESSVAGVRISHPERVMYPETGLTKLELARFYEDIADWIMPGLLDRPLTLVRCPEGREGECFFQKHLGKTLAKHVPRVGFRESSGVKQYTYVQSIAHLVALVQAGVLEFHPFGCRVDDLEHPDLVVFDLDPSPGVSWEQMLRTTRELRERIEQEYRLACFLRTTGGKGLHVVVPLQPRADWDEVKAFAQAVSQQHAADDPTRLTTNMSKAKRKGKIFIDYLRNSRGATAIASYSTRARENATVSVPLRWDELGAGLRSDHYNVGNLRRRLIALKRDPWMDFDEAAKPLTRELLAAAGVKGG